MLWLFFLGLFGAHRFYVGKKWTGLLYILTFGFLGLGVVVDFIRIALYSFKDKAGNDLKADCPIPITFIIGCYLLTLLMVVCSGIFPKSNNAEINKLYTTGKQVTAIIGDGVEIEEYTIDKGDIFWVVNKVGNEYVIETNGRTMRLAEENAIEELQRTVKIEEYIDNRTLFAKNIKEIEVKKQVYNLEYLSEIGYITKDNIEIHNLKMNKSLGKEFIITSGLYNADGIIKWYIIDLGDGRYSYISADDMTINKDDISSLQGGKFRAKEYGVEKEYKKTKDYKLIESEDTDTDAEDIKYDVTTEDGIHYMSADTVVGMYRNDKDTLRTYVGKNVCITGRVRDLLYGEVVEYKNGEKSTVYPSVLLDTDTISSWFGISLEINDLSFNDFMKKNNIEEGKSILRAYGTGESNSTFSVKNCYYIELLDGNGKVIDTWKYKG